MLFRSLVDLHTHILPGIDDGARDYDQSLAILRKAEQARVKKVVLTPHVLNTPTPCFVNNILQIFTKLKQKAIKEEIDVELLLGAEIFISPETSRIITDYPSLTLNQTGRYLLLELPLLETPDFVSQVIYELILKGITPIIAHPERNLLFQKEIEVLAEFSRQGVLTQVNITSLAGYYGKKVKKIAQRLLYNRLVDFLASDVHTLPKDIYPLRKYLSLAEQCVDKQELKDMLVPDNVLPSLF